MENVKEAKWPAVAMQGIILSNITLIEVAGSRPFNVFFLFSAISILSLFILQSVSRRFLLLFPYNQFMNKETPSIDTYILRILLITSVLSFFIGLIDFRACNQIFINIDSTFLCFLTLLFIFIFSFFLLILLPIIWKLFLKEETVQQIIKKLKKTKYLREIVCPDKGCGGK